MKSDLAAAVVALAINTLLIALFIARLCGQPRIESGPGLAQDELAERLDRGIQVNYPDFLVKLTAGRIVVVEMHRLRQWCEDTNRMQSDVTYDFVYVDDESFKKYEPKSFGDLLAGFQEYKGTI